MAAAQWRRSRDGRQRHGTTVTRVPGDFSGEARQIIHRALAGDARVVSLGPLVFFSTTTGDAWMLDPEDGLAMCLALAYEEQPYSITETSKQLAVAWAEAYEIVGDLFVVSDLRSARTRSICGYPVAEIMRTIEIARRHERR